MRHLLAHASGLAMLDDAVLAKPGTRRIYSNSGFRVLAETLEAATEMSFGDYLTEAIFQPLAMSDSALPGGAAEAGFGAVSTVADLASFAGDLLAPATVSPQMHAEAVTVQFPGLGGVLPGYGSQRPNDWGWVSSFATARARTGRARTTQRRRSAISASQAPSSGPIRTRDWRPWC